MTDHQFFDMDAGWWDVAPRHGKRVLRKKDAAPAPAPDPLIGQAAAQNVELGREQLALARDQYSDNKARQDEYDKLTGKVAQSALDSQDMANKWAQQDRDIQAGYRTKYDGWADEDRQLGRDTKALDDKLANQALASGDAYESKFQNIGQQALDASKKYEAQFNQTAAQQNGLAASQIGRYQNTFAPVENKVASDAMNWDSAGRQESMAAEAKADAVAAGSQAKDAASRSMMAMGVNPNSGRFAATDQANATALALAGAGAQNTARNNVRMQGVQLRQQAAQLGQQVLSSGQQATSLGMQATGAAQSAGLAGTSAALQATGAAQTAKSTGVSTAMQAQNQGLAAAGIGNTTASLGLSNQGGGYAGLGTGLSAGSAATGAIGAANANNFNTNNAMMNGFAGAVNANASGAGIANSLYGNQLNAWGQQQQANAQQAGGLMSGIGSLVGTGASMYML